MASKYSSKKQPSREKKHSSTGGDQSTGASDWIWDASCSRYYYVDSKGNCVYQNTASGTNEAEPNAAANSTPQDSIPPQGDPGSEFGTSANYTVGNLTDGVGSMGLDKGKGRARDPSYPDSTYGNQTPSINNPSYVNPIPNANTYSAVSPSQIPRSFYPVAGQGTLDNAYYSTPSRGNTYFPNSSQNTDQQYSTASAPYWPATDNYSSPQSITSPPANPTTSGDTGTPLNSSYTVHHAKEFKFGSVFKVLWAEPTGAHGTQITDPAVHQSTAHGQDFTHKFRRFVVVKVFDGHCLALPILTYGKRATTKSGSHSKDHAAVFTGDQPTIYEGESGLKKPIKIVPKTPREKLDPQSRMNYAKVYTIEYNVKVHFVGRVHPDHRRQLQADYHNTHAYTSSLYGQDGPSE